MSTEHTGFDQQLFRDVLARFPAGVVVVTAQDPETGPAGLTVSAFCSVSADPALVLVCVDRGSQTLPAIQRAGAYTVNILAAGREELAMRFASKRSGAEKYEGVTWRAPEIANGGPILHEDAAAYLVCEVEQEVEAGDHIVFIGRAVEGGLHEEPTPLLFHQRGFAIIG